MESSSTAPSSSKPTILPTITIQPSFTSVLSDIHTGQVPSETFWVSIYKQGESSVHASVSANLDEANRDLVVLKSFDVVVEGRGREYSVECEKMMLGVGRTRLVVPVQTYVDEARADPHHPHRITALAIAPTRTHYATGGLDGTLLLYPIHPTHDSPKRYHDTPASLIKPTSHARSTPSHLSTLTSLSFFPSSKVLLTTSGDFSLAVFPADEPSATEAHAKIAPVRTLKAHTRAVNGSAMIGRGKRVVSCGADGTVRVWDVAKGASAHAIWCDSEVVAVEVVPADEGQEIEVKLLVYAAQATGVVASYELLVGPPPEDKELPHITSKRLASTSRPTAAGSLTCMALSDPIGSSSQRIIATASSTGLVSIYVTSSNGSITSTPITRALRGTGTTRIESIAFLPSTIASTSQITAKLVVGSADGTTCILSISLPDALDASPDAVVDASPDAVVDASPDAVVDASPDAVVDASPDAVADISLEAELVGPDCDPVYVVRVLPGEMEVWTGSDDGVVRRYFV